MLTDAGNGAGDVVPLQQAAHAAAHRIRRLDVVFFRPLLFRPFQSVVQVCAVAVERFDQIHVDIFPTGAGIQLFGQFVAIAADGGMHGDIVCHVLDAMLIDPLGFNIRMGLQKFEGGLQFDFVIHAGAWWVVCDFHIAFSCVE